MRIDTSPTRPTTSPAPNPSTASVSSSKTETPSPESRDCVDRFDPIQHSSGWGGFSGGRRVKAPHVKQARAAQSPPADVGPSTSLADAVFRRADKLPNDKTHGELRGLYADAEKLAQSGDYASAADKLDRALSRYEEEIDGSKALGNGGVAGTRSLVGQYRFLADMKARGVAASNPPTESELKSYFRTFDNKKDRPEALKAYAKYSEAFFVHPANVGRPNDDIKYSADPVKYAHGNKLYDKEADAEKAQQKKGGDITELPTADASSWAEVTTDRDRVGLEGGHAEHAGKYVNDCEGYAYSAETLLKEAGYKTEQVAVQAKTGEQHGMTVLTDPSRPKSVAVASNGKVFEATKRADALDAGFSDAMPDTAVADKYFTGRSQHEAQVKLLFHYRNTP